MRHSKILMTCLAMTVLSASAWASQTERRSRGTARVSLVDRQGQSLPKVNHNGKTYYIGKKGQVFQVKVKNEGGRRIEAVVSVDGRDVLTGRKATSTASGYLVDGNGSTLIKGWRTSQSSVAEFEFTKEDHGYDAQMGGDGLREGKVGVAVYLERPRLREIDFLMAGGGGMRRGRMMGGPASLGLERGGLSTDFGDEITDRVNYVHFDRASSTPDTILTLNYGTAKGLTKMGVPKHLIDTALGHGGGGDDISPFHDQPSPGDFAPRPPGRRRGSR